VEKQERADSKRTARPSGVSIVEGKKSDSLLQGSIRPLLPAIGFPYEAARAKMPLQGVTPRLILTLHAELPRYLEELRSRTISL
jgi:hypothetical protein